MSQVQWELLRAVKAAESAKISYVASAEQALLPLAKILEQVLQSAVRYSSDGAMPDLDVPRLILTARHQLTGWMCLDLGERILIVPVTVWEESRSFQTCWMAKLVGNEKVNLTVGQNEMARDTRDLLVAIKEYIDGEKARWLRQEPSIINVLSVAPAAA